MDSKTVRPSHFNPTIPNHVALREDRLKYRTEWPGAYDVAYGGPYAPVMPMNMNIIGWRADSTMMSHLLETQPDLLIDTAKLSSADYLQKITRKNPGVSVHVSDAYPFVHRRGPVPGFRDGRPDNTQDSSSDTEGSDNDE